jgi:hypothetical protein
VRPRSRQTRTSRTPCGLALAAALALSFSAIAATDVADRRPQPAAADPLDVSGADFAGVQFPGAARDGPLAFSASRATVWRSGAGATQTTRLFLEGDVTAQVGDMELSAARAVVWFQAVGADEASKTELQFYIYFDRASMPRAAPGKLTISGDRIPMFGIIRTESGATLKADKLLQGPATDPLVREAERSLAGHLRKLVRPAEPGDPPPPRPEAGLGEPPDIARPFDPARAIDGPALAELERGLPPAVRDEPIFARSGVISLAFGEPGAGGTLQAFADGDDDVVQFDRGIVVQYRDRDRDRALQLTAQRGVVYLKPGLIRGLGDGQTSFDVGDVRGFYLEGDVVADSTERDLRGVESHYLVRAPRAYYDVQHDRALLLEAVFWTYNQKIGLPLYVRAKTIRQESASQFSAGSARVTNTGFADPFLALGAGSVTLTRKDPPTDAPADADRPWIVDARNITARLGGVPVLYWPRYVGDPSKFPLRELSFSDSYGSGPAVRTAWNVLSLAGIEPPDGVDAGLLLDYYSERGPGLGATLSLDRPGARGDLLIYGLPHDTGTDHLSTGARLDHDGDTRDVVVGEFQKRLDENWTLQLDGSFFSDETVVDTFFREDARSRREFENAAYLARLDDDSALTLEAKGSLNDFTPNQYLLQDQGYTVDRLPEATYTRLGDDLLAGAAPGLLSWSSEYRIGRYALDFTEPSARELGFDTRGRSRSAFDILPDESIADRLRSEGYTEDAVFRFDTRHEITSQLRYGPVNMVPFAAGRVTAYDRDFSEFNAGNDDQVRTWGSVGTRFASEIQRVDNSVESRTFDLHRMRHVIEPGLTFWYAGTNIDQADLPVYDDAVESIADGGAVRIGANQTWQTQRGGPGRYRSVDVLTLDTDFQFSTEDSEPESPVGRWFDFRPEYSNLGDFFTADSTWQVTEALALSGNTVFDLDRNRQAQTSAGLTIQHSPEFRTSAEVLYLDVEDSTFVNLAAAYDITDKHSLASYIIYDTDQGKAQQVSLEILRRFPSVFVGLSLGYNDITEESSFGFNLQPVGAKGKGARLRGLGAANDRSQASSFGQ